MSDPTPAAPAVPVQPTPRPEGETTLRAAIGDWRLAAHCMGGRSLCGSCIESLVRAVRAEAASLKTESEGRRGLLDLAKAQLSEKDAEITRLKEQEQAFLLGEENKHNEAYAAGWNASLVRDRPALKKQLAERDAEAAAQTARAAELEKVLSASRQAGMEQAIEYGEELASLEKQLAEVTREREEARDSFAYAKNERDARHNEREEQRRKAVAANSRADKAEAQLAAQAEHCKTLAEALEAFVAVHVEDGTCGPESSSKAEDPSQEWCGWCAAARAALSGPEGAVAPAAPEEHK